MIKIPTEPIVDLNSPGSKTKTFYVGFHDGVKKGIKPQVQYEPDPIQIEISHKDATRIVMFLYQALKEMTEEPIPKYNGQWP